MVGERLRTWQFVAVVRVVSFNAGGPLAQTLPAVTIDRSRQKVFFMTLAPKGVTALASIGRF